MAKFHFFFMTVVSGSAYADLDYSTSSYSSHQERGNSSHWDMGRWEKITQIFVPIEI